MSYCVVQIGECGNQLGHEFFNTLAEKTLKKRNAKNYEYVDKSESRFFSYNEKEDKKYAHAVLLDTESQVIKSITQPSKSSWSYSADCYKILNDKSAKNWALEFKVNGPLFKDFVLDAVQKEIESYDQFYGFLLFGSIAGGSGSGLCSYVSEVLRSEFPSVSLASISIWPFPHEGVCIQEYNTVLNLSALQNSSDAIFVFENNCLLKLCDKMGLEEVSKQDLYSIVGQQVANLLLPTDSVNNPTLNDMLAHIVPHPQFKLISLRSVPQEPLSSLPYCSYSWASLFRSLRRMLLYSTAVDEVYGPKNPPPQVCSPPISLSNLLFLRGKNCGSADINYLYKPQLPYASWVPKSSRMNIWTDSNPFLSCDRTALLANNGQLSLPCVEKTVTKAWNMFSHKTCFHLYKEYGLSEEDFLSSYLNVGQIVYSYKSLKT